MTDFAAAGYAAGDRILVPGPSTPIEQRRGVVVEVPAIVDGEERPHDVRVRMNAPDGREFVLAAFSLKPDANE